MSSLSERMASKEENKAVEEQVVEDQNVEKLLARVIELEEENNKLKEQTIAKRTVDKAYVWKDIKAADVKLIPLGDRYYLTPIGKIVSVYGDVLPEYLDLITEVPIVDNTEEPLPKDCLSTENSPEHPAATYTRKTVNDCHMELTHYKDDIYINKDGYYVRVVERGRIV